MQGGLILPRRPRSSALGLDVLAKRKRESQGSDASRPLPHKEEAAAEHGSGEISRADCRRRWEWEDTPRREYRDDPPAPRRQHPAPSPWDNVYSLPSAPVRPSGSSKGPSSCNDTEAGTRPPTADGKFKVTEEMMQEMNYNVDRTWYGCEEQSSIFNAGNYLGDDASFQNKEAKLSKKLTRQDGSLMTLAQSKRLSQVTAENARWEVRQLFRSGAVRRTEVQTEFDDEDERKVILLVHDTKPPFLDGRVVFTTQAEPVMPLKDPTSDMAIIARKGSLLVREICEKQSMNKSRQRF